VEWGIQVLGALEYLHGHQPPIIHRDIKPQNLKMTERGEVILLDFGLAKGSGSGTSQVSRSVQGYTLRYAPLEQIRGLGTDPRSDLYSLAASLYHLMTNVAPPDALDRVSALVSKQRDPLSLADQLNPRVPPTIARILHATMDSDRDRRPPGAAAMRGALERAIKESSSASTAVIGSNQTTLAGRSPETSAAGQLTAVDSTAPTIRNQAVASHPSHASAPQPAVAQSTPTSAPTVRSSTGKKLWIWGGAGALVVLIALAIGGYLLLGRAPTMEAIDGGAASADRNNPTPLTSKIILCGPGVEERYFKFDAKRGALVLTLDVLAGGSSVTVELLDNKSENVRFDNGSANLSVNSAGHIEEARGRVLVEREQTILMRVAASYPKELRVYRLKLDGEIALAGGFFGGPPKASTVLSDLLADRDRPVKLASRDVLSGGTAKDLYYSFSAGPGEVTLTVNVFGTGGTAAVELFDEESKSVRFEDGRNLSVNSTGHNEQDAATVLIKKKQMLLMRVTNSYPNETRAIRIRLGGPIQGATGRADTDAVSQALAKYFADRDNPTRLTKNEISGRGNDKDLYYVFQAGPGSVKVKLEVEGNGGSVSIELFDAKGERLRSYEYRDRFSLTSNNEGSKDEEAGFELDSEQKLIMRISQSYPNDLRSFKITFDGAVKLEGISQPEG
jgi:serine/threonine protein kinase